MVLKNFIHVVKRRFNSLIKICINKLESLYTYRKNSVEEIYAKQMVVSVSLYRLNQDVSNYNSVKYNNIKDRK